jgi:hypothetical protein
MKRRARSRIADAAHPRKGKETGGKMVKARAAGTAGNQPCKRKQWEEKKKKKDPHPPKQLSSGSFLRSD